MGCRTGEQFGVLPQERVAAGGAKYVDYGDDVCALHLEDGVSKLPKSCASLAVADNPGPPRESGTQTDTAKVDPGNTAAGTDSNAATQNGASAQDKNAQG